MKLPVRFVVLLACLLPISFLLSLHGADGVTTKSPYEQIDLSLDFLPQAANGVTLRQIQVLDGLADVTTAILASLPAPAVQRSKVVFRVKDGATRHDYLILVRVAKLDTAELLEGSVLLHVRVTQ